jgi:uncharacterized protein (TIGR02996 family)
VIPGSASFLEAICTDPEDDGPRLVYADWLDEHGQPDRADFIRVQITLARMAQDDTRRAELEAREKELRRRNHSWWRGPNVPDWLRAQGRIKGFDRGFWESVEIDPLFEFGTRPVTRHGGIHLRANDQPVTAEQLREALSLNPFRRLTLNAATADVARAVAAAPHAASLRSLALIGAGMHGCIQDARAVAALAASPHLARLDALHLDAHPVGDDAARAFARGKIRGLTHLAMSACWLEDSGVAALAESPVVAGLRVLDLSYNCFGEAGARALIESPHLTHLTRLYTNWQHDLGDGAHQMLRRHFKRRLHDVLPGR